MKNTDPYYRKPLSMMILINHKHVTGLWVSNSLILVPISLLHHSFFQAVKEFNKKFLKRKRNWKKVDGKMKMTNALDTVKLEVALMKKLHHPNLCKMIEVIDDDGHQRLYMGKY